MSHFLKSVVIASVLFIAAYSLFAVSSDMSIESFTKLPAVRDVQISPDGKHLSVIFRNDGQDKLAILDRETRKVISGFSPKENKDVDEVYWVNDNRLVYSMLRSHSYDKQRYSTGELAGVSIDGSAHELIFGYTAGGKRRLTKMASFGSHEVIDLLEDDTENILITYYPWKLNVNRWYYDKDVTPRIVKLNVYTGEKVEIERLPIKNSEAIVDNNGEVRFAIGVSDSNENIISYKKDAGGKWQEFSLNNFEGQEITPKSFSEDNEKVYLSANVGEGTRALYLFDLKKEKFEKLYHNEKIDISRYMYDFDGRRIVAVATELQTPEYHYLDNQDRKVFFHKMLMKNFPGFDAVITSTTKDRKYFVFYAYSDYSPGDYYLYDVDKNKAEFLLTRQPSIDISQTVNTKSIKIKTRDGTEIYGYLTLPKNSKDNLPMVVLPHGGPHGLRDEWGFDWKTQLLASRGYAVLQVNFRGSGGFGIKFEKSGYGKWGTLMQDDISDATKAMITSGIADSHRICIFGASYGGYAALMGSIREPDLYRCAIGSMGVYNLPMMFEEGDIADRESGLAYLKDVLGEDIADQKSRSPVYNVDKIKADLLLIHGKRDERAPIEQAESLMDALDKIKKPYEWLELDNEGHGYYDEANRLLVYTKVLDFLDRKIGEKAIKTTKK